LSTQDLLQTSLIHFPEYVLIVLDFVRTTLKLETLRFLLHLYLVLLSRCFCNCRKNEGILLSVQVAQSGKKQMKYLSVLQNLVLF